MNLKQIETTITDLKSKVNKKKEAGADRILVRKAKKCLKRAQRKRAVMAKNVASLSDKKKKEEAAS